MLLTVGTKSRIAAHTFGLTTFGSTLMLLRLQRYATLCYDARNGRDDLGHGNHQAKSSPSRSALRLFAFWVHDLDV
jgi:hypothetical protein